MLARTQKPDLYAAWLTGLYATRTVSPAFLAEVDAIKADARARRAQLAADRASFWERATSDVQWDYDNERWNNGEGEV